MDGMNILKGILREKGERIGTEFVWVRIGASGCFLRIRYWAFALNKNQEFLDDNYEKPQPR
jgi:hypothetical protein